MMKKQITVLTGAAMLMMAALSGCSAGAANGNAAPATTAAATEAVKQETEAEKPAESKAESGAVEAAHCGFLVKQVVQLTQQPVSWAII